MRTSAIDRPPSSWRCGLGGAIGAIALLAFGITGVQAADSAHDLADRFARPERTLPPPRAQSAKPAAEAKSAPASQPRPVAVIPAAGAAPNAQDMQRRADEADMLERARADAADASRAAEEAARREAVERALIEEQRRADAEAKAAAEQTARSRAAGEAAAREREQAAAEAVAREQAAAEVAARERAATEAAAGERAVADAAAREAAERKALEAIQAAEAQEIIDRVRAAQAARAAARDAALTAVSPAPTPVAVPPSTPAALPTPSPAAIAKLDPTLGTRVTVLLVMKPGDRGIRRTDKTADPVVCVAESCYISRGAAADARQVPRWKAFGTLNTLGDRAGACNKSLQCVFRNVDLEAASALVQPVDLRIMRHDRREAREGAPDGSCEMTGGRLSCSRGITALDYRVWLVPEPLAREAGFAVLEAAVASGLVAAGRPGLAEAGR